MNEGQRPDPSRLAAAVIALLEPELATEGLDLLDVRVFRGGGRLQLRIYLDTFDGGITMAQCTAASRSAGMLMEEADLIAERYVIEVSSPGIRRPLRKPEHFAAAVGQRVDLRTDARKRVKGVLTATGPDGHVIAPAEEGAEPVTVDPDKVKEANLDPDFDVQSIINADRRAKKAAKREKRQKRSPTGRRRSKSDKRGRDDETPGSDRTDGST